MGKTMNIKNISLGILLGLYGGGAALANPTGANIVHGSASISANGDLLQITNSPNAIINWQSFSIANGETTQFIQQNAQSAVLNRVVGNNLSEIHGTLSSNGRVFLINQAGIVFGENALVDTAGLLASSLNISNEDFLSGNMHFEGDSAGSVINRGVIAAGPSGEVVLIAPQIENSGVITVQEGSLILAAGESVTLSSWDLDGVEFEVQAPENEILNLGQLVADKGAVGLFAGSIRNEGTIEANSLSLDAAGNIVLSAQQNIELSDSSVISASGDSAGDILVISEQGDVYASGSLSASSTEGEGGSVKILGERVALLDGASVDVSGATGGGEALIGGDYQGANEEIKNASFTHVAETASINADALENGDGGKVIVWADKNTVMLGDASAKGGEQQGDGGFIEISGKESLVMRGRVDATAENGERGQILFDPKNIIVGGAGLGSLAGNTLFSENSADDTTFSVSAITTALLGGNVKLQANNDVTFVESLTSLGNGSNLEVEAGRSVLISAGVIITLENGDFNVLANAPSTGGTPVDPGNRDLGAADIRLAAGASINTGGGNVSLVIGDGAGRTGGFSTIGNVSLIDADVATEGGVSATAGNIVVSAGVLQLDATSSLDATPNGGGTAGSIIIEANDIELANGAFLDSGTGADASNNITIRTRSDNPTQNISLGYAVAQAGTLSLDANELIAGIRTNGESLNIGDASHTGDINIGGEIAVSNYDGLNLTTQGDVNFLQNTSGINLGGQNVTISADRILGSTLTTLSDITAGTVMLNANNGMQQAGGGGLAITASSIDFTNTTSGDVTLITRGAGLSINNSSNANGDIEISHLDATNLTLDGVSVGSGSGYIAAFTSFSGSNIVLGSLGVTHNGSGNIELTAGGAGNSVQQGTGAISTVNGNISIQASDFSLSGTNINAGTGNVYIAPSQNSIALNLTMGGFDSFMLNGITAQNVILGTKHFANTGTTSTSASAINWGSAMGTLNTSYNLFLETEPTGTITLESPITLAAGNNLTFTTNDLVLNAGGIITGTTTSDLVVNHNGASGGIGIDTAGGMSISAAELALMQGSFDHVAFQTQQAGNAINIGGAGVSFAHETRLNSMSNVGIGASLDITGTSKDLTINAGTGSNIALGESVSTAGGNINFNSAVSVQGDHSVASNNGDIAFNSTVDSDLTGRNLTVNAGTGLVNYNGNIGQVAALNTLVTSGSGGININAASITTLQNQVFNDATNLLNNTNLSSTAGAVMLNGAVNGAFGLTVNANTVASLSNISGVSSLNATTTTGSINAGDISTTGNQQYTGKLLIGGDLTTAGGDILINDDAELNGTGTQVISTGSGDITFVKNLDGDSGMPGSNILNVNAGTGNVLFGTDAGANSIGQTSALSDILVTANNITLDQIGSAGPDVAGVTGNTVLTATNTINFNGNHVVANNQNYTASGGYIHSGDHQVIVVGGGDLNYNGGNVQSAADSKLEFITDGGTIDFTTTNILSDGSSSNTEVIINSGGGTIDVNNIGQNGVSTTQLNNLFVDAGAGIFTMHGDIDLGDHANAAVKISADTIIMNTNAEIETDKAVNDGKIFILTNDLQLTALSGINSGDADIVIDTQTTANQITFGAGPGLSLSNAEMANITSNGKIRIGLDAAAVSDLGGGAIRSGDIDFAETINQSSQNYVLNTTGNISSSGAQATDLTANNLDIVGASIAGISAVDSFNINVNNLSGVGVGQVNIADADSLVVSDFELITNAASSSFSAANNLTIDQIRVANGGSIDLVSTSGSILDGNSGGGNQNNITAVSGNLQNISLTATTGISNSTDVFEISNMAGSLSVDNTGGTGDIYIANINSGGGAFEVSSVSNTAVSGTTEIRNGVTNEAFNLTGPINVTSGGSLVLNSNNGAITTSAAINAGSASINSGTANTVLGGNVTTASGLSIAANNFTQSGGIINVSGLLDLNTDTGINLTQAGNIFNQVQANNSTSGSIAITSSGALTVFGAGVQNQSTGAADNIELISSGLMTVDGSVKASGGDVSLNSNNNDIAILSSGGNSTEIDAQSAASNITINAGTGDITLLGGSANNSDVSINGGVGGSLQIIARDLTLQAGNGDSSSTRINANTTDIDLSGGLNLTAGTGASASEVSIDGDTLLDIDLSGTGDITLTAGGASSNMSNAVLGSQSVINIDTGGNVILNGGAGTNSLAAIGNDTSAVTVNIGQAAAIGGDVLLNGGTGAGSVAAIGIQSSSASVSDAIVSVRADGDVKAVANTGGVQVGAFEQAGSTRSAAGSVFIEAGLGASGGNIELENAIVQTGTSGQVTLAAHEVSNLPSVGRVSQGAAGSILADQLYVQTFNAGNHFHVDLQATGNNVNNLAIRMLDVAGTGVSAGQAYYNDADSFAIDASALSLVTGESAIQGSATAEVKLTSGGSITQAADVNSAVGAGFVQVNTVSGVTLDNAENNVSFFGADNTVSGDVILVEQDGFNIGGLSGFTGIKNTSGNVTLLSTGAISQSASSVHSIETGHLRAETRSAGSSINLSNNFNDVDTLTLRVLTSDGLAGANGAIDFIDVDDLQILGTGLTTGEFALQSDSFARITAGGVITQGSLVEDGIQLNNFLGLKTLNNSGAGITLANTNNSFTGSLDLATKNVADDTVVNASSSVFNSLSIIADDISSLGDVTLITAANIDQTTGSTIAVGTLNVNAQTGIDLDDPLDRHMIGVLSATNTSSGDIVVNNNQSWTVDATNNATGGNISLNNAASGGNTTLGVLNATTGAVSLQTGTNIVDGNGAASNVIANQVTLLDAGTGIGSMADGIELEAATIASVNTASGDVVLIHNQAGAQATFGQVIVDGSGTGNIHISSALADADIAIGTLLSTGGTGGSGDITLETAGANSDITINNTASVGTTGNLAVNSAGDFNQDGNLGLAGATRNASITAAGNITMGAAGTTTNNTGGATAYNATGALTVNTITTAGDLNLVGQGIDVNADVATTAGNLVLDAQTGDININGSTVNTAGTATVNAASLSILAGTNKAEISANGNVDVTLSGDATLTAGSGGSADAILKSDSGNLSLSAVNIAMTTGTTQDALIKAANGSVTINRSGTCPDCNTVTVTAGADAGIVTNDFYDLLAGVFNWSGFGDGVSWNDASNWFGNAVATSGDINLDANSSAPSSTINVNSVITANSLSGTKELNIVAGGDLTIDDFTYGNTITLSGGDLNLGGTSNTLNGDLTISGTGSVLTTAADFAANGLVALSGGDLLLNGTTSVFNGGLTVSNANSSLTASSDFSSTGATQLSAGNLTLNGSSNTLGVTSVSGGDLVLNSSTASISDLDVSGGAVTTAGVLTVSNTMQLDAGVMAGAGSLSLNDFNWSGGDLGVDADATGTTLITGASVKQLSANLFAFDATVNGTGNLDIVSSGDLYVDSSSPGLTLIQGDIISSDNLGTVSNEGFIGKSGAGAVSISALLNNTGGLSQISVNDGSLSIGATSVALNVDDATYSVSPSAQLTFAEDRSLQGVLTTNAGSTLTAGANTNLTLAGTGSILDGDVDLANNATLIIDAAQTFNGAVSDSSNGSITANANASFNQGMDISGTLQVASGQAVTTGAVSNVGSLQLSGTLTAANDVNVANLLFLNNGTLTAAANVDVAGLLSLNGGTIDGVGTTLSASDVNMSVNSSVSKDLSVSNTMNWVSGDLNLSGNDLQISSGATLNMSSSSSILQGAMQNQGTVNLSGILDTANGYTQTAGLTNLNGGTLKAVSAAIQGGSLTGSGDIDGSLVISNATLAPGNSAGTINVSGNLDLAAGSNLALQLGGLAPVNSDQLNVAGNLTIDPGASLSVSLINGLVLSEGDTFSPLSYASVSGDFGTSSLPENLNTTLGASDLSLLAVITVTEPEVVTSVVDNNTAGDAEDFADVDDEIAELFGEFEDEINDLEDSGSEEDEDEDESADLTEEGEVKTEFSGTLVCS